MIRSRASGRCCRHFLQFKQTLSVRKLSVARHGHAWYFISWNVHIFMYILNLQNNQFMVSNSDTISIVDQLPNAGSVTTGNPHCQIDQADITDQLKHWAIKNNINHSALRDLLSVLSGTREHYFHRLPKDPRTFLSTPRKSVIRKVDPGCYCHIGIQKSLQQQYQILQETPTDIIEIGINIDGLPLTKSSSSQFYPILVAKASVLYIKGHSGYSSCTKCTQTGEFLKDRVCFPGLTFIKRTHDEFVLQTDEDHHTGYSLLAEIPEINLINEIPLDYMHLTDEDHHTGYSLLAEIPEINLINEIPLDYMHLVCLGVVKLMKFHLITCTWYV
ncbi:hypothetical protein QE152_g5046 [Popillia japonica]|uniref:Uncharacterized protein n=1 Tax=Popillia japonica TaxID=7064 RepID=A0AAW1MQX6_POPJA